MSLIVAVILNLPCDIYCKDPKKHQYPRKKNESKPFLPIEILIGIRVLHEVSLIRTFGIHNTYYLSSYLGLVHMEDPSMSINILQGVVSHRRFT